MFIESIVETPFSTITYLNAAPGSRGTDIVEFPFLRGTVRQLPEALDALFIASDMQGRTRGPDGQSILLGCTVAEHLYELGETHQVPRAERVGIVLAGDLYSDPAARKRGCTGEVTPVWTAFANRFPFVAGVAGNHDTFEDRRWLKAYPGVRLLDGDVEDCLGLRIGGVGGIIGSPRKNERKTEDRFLDALLDVAAQAPDLIVLHQGPNNERPRRRGSPAVREALLASYGGVTAFGHCHWPEPLTPLAGGQLLSVDARGVLLERKR